MNRTEINPHTHGRLICNKGTKNIQRRKARPSVNGAKKTGQSHAKI